MSVDQELMCSRFRFGDRLAKHLATASASAAAIASPRALAQLRAEGKLGKANQGRANPPADSTASSPLPWLAQCWLSMQPRLNFFRAMRLYSDAFPVVVVSWNTRAPDLHPEMMVTKMGHF